MNKTMKKLISIMLVVLMCVTATPLDGFVGLDLGFTASATDASGKIGDNVSYTFDETTGAVTITGSGDMYNYDDESNRSPFYWNDSVKSVAIDEGVTSVGNYVFWMCNDLAAVTLPNTLKTIGEEAFYSCGFTSVTIPENVETISNEAFLCCYSLTDVNIPKGVNTIGQTAFRSCEKLKAITVDESNEKYASIDGVLFNKDKTTLVYCPEGKTDESYTVPAGVTTIGTYAFHYAKNIKSITMTNDVTTLCDDAFDSCEKLESITLSNQITKIPQYAFFWCKALKSVDIPAGVTELGSNAFNNCVELKTITLPSSLTSVGTSAFYGCSALADVYYGGTEAQWNKIVIGSINTPLTNATIHYAYIQLGENVLAKLDETTGELTITGTGDMYDYNTSTNKSPLNGNTDIKSVTIGEGVTKVGTSVFSGCTSLESIDLPASANIGFNDTTVAGLGSCTKLKSINVDEDNTNLASVDGVLFDKGMTTLILYPCAKADKSYTVPDGVTGIFNSAFANNTNLESVTLGSDVWQISSQAFNNCTALKSLTLTSSVTSVADGAFNGCTALSDIYFIGTADEWNALDLGTEISTATVHYMTQIGENVYYCFDETTGEVTIIGTGEMYDYSPFSGDSPFYMNSNVKSVTIGEGVENIGNYLFYYCTNLDSLTIPSTVKKIGARAFSYCKLTTLVIPGNVETIGSYAFQGCKITNLTISDGVKNIGGGAFWISGNFETVNIPKSVESIGNNAFTNCGKLQSITVDADNEYYTAVDGVLFNKAMTELMQYPTAKTTEDYTVPESVKTIANRAFFNNKNIKSITMADNVETIGEYVFSSCNKLESVKLSNKLTSISPYAFNNCSALTSIDIPEGVTTIGNGAFCNCTSLKTITIPSTLTTIGYMAFYDCEAFTDVYYDGTEAQWNAITIGEDNAPLTNATIHYALIQLGDNVFAKLDETTGELKVTGTGDMYDYAAFEEEGALSPLSKNLDIKSITIAEGITSIGDGVFKSCQQAASVSLPSTIKSIGKHAFDDCHKLNNVVIPAGCETIGEYAFYACFGLSNLTITNGVKSIGDEAFSYCTALTNVTIPASVETIGKRPFNLCNKLQSITVDADNENYATDDGVLFNKDKTVLISYPQNKTDEAYTVPDSVKTIEELAFYANQNIKSVVLGENVETLGNSAFSSCRSLASVTISTKLTSISDNAFKNTVLTDVYYGGYEAQWKAITIGENNDALDSATIHYAYIQLGENVFAKFDETTGEVKITGTGEMYNYEFFSSNRSPFYENTKIKSVTIDEGVTSVGDYVFNSCSKLATVSFPTSLEKIGERAFEYCGLTSLTIPGNVETIGKNAFYYCNSLTTVTISDGVQSIGKNAFCECTALTSITVDADNENYTSIDGVLFNKDKTTLICYPAAKTGESYLVPAGVTTIEENAFNGAQNIKSITMTNDVTTLGSTAFADCSKLESVTLSNQIEKIPYSAFYFCQALTSVVIPEGVTEIGVRAFYYCDALETITLPHSLTTIDNYAFYNTALTDVYYDGTEAQWNAITIGDYNTPLTDATKHFLIQIGENVFAKFDETTGEVKITGSGEMYNYAAIKSEGTVSPFNGNTDVKSVTIGDGITSVGAYVFRSCTDLTTVSFPTTLKTIGKQAFYFCGFESLTIPGNVETIGDKAFCGCIDLATVTISDGVKTIGERAFESCLELKSITIPASVQSIGKNAFVNCKALTSITVDENNKNYTSVDGVLFNKAKTTLVCYPAGKTDESYLVPAGVTTIEENAFNGATNIKSITMTNDVTTLGSKAFSGCSSLTDVYYDGYEAQWKKITIGTYNTPLTNATIHYAYNIQLGDDVFAKLDDETGAVDIIGSGDMYDYDTSSNKSPLYNNSKVKSITINEGITSVGNYAFSSCNNLTTVTFPTTLNTIGKQAFYSCGLTSLTIPGSVETMGDYAFSGCENLATVTILNGVKTIGKKAFSFCEKLKNITISASVETIGEGAFDTCKALTSINVDPDNKNYASIDGVLFNKDKTTLICYPAGKTDESYLVPAGVTTIEKYAFFFAQNVKSITMTNDVTTLGSNAFAGCQKLESITLSNKIETISIEAFSSCAALTNVVIPEGEITKIERNAFYCCTALTSIVIPEGVTEIGNSAFESCTALEEITLPHSLQKVGNNAFAYYNRGYSTLNVETVYYNACQGQKGDFAKITFGTNNDCVKNADVICIVEHSFGDVQHSDLSCLEDGYDYKQCSICELYYAGSADVTATGGVDTYEGFITPATGHDFDDVVNTTDATCTADGVSAAYKQCKNCKKYFDETAGTTAANGADTNEAYIIKATGHIFHTQEAQDPDCTTGGWYTFQVCDICEELFEADADKFSTDNKAAADFKRDALGHTFTDVPYKAATCLEDGNEAYRYCAACNKYFDATADDKATNGADTNEAYIISATGHNFNDTVTGYAPDCCNDGIDSYKTCSNCYKYFAANADEFSTDSEESDVAFIQTAIGHNFGDIVEVKPATCTEDGVKIAYKYCDKCGLYYDASARDTEIFGQGTENPSRFIENAHGHNFTDVPFTAAKCTESGNEVHKYCVACEKYFDATAEKFDTNGADDNSAYIIAATGHEFTGTVKMDTDGKDGKHSFACVNGCGEYGDAVAHVWDAGDVTTPATHLEEGVMTYKCECGATYTAPIAKTAEHNHIAGTPVEPTCTEQGYTVYTCECGDSYKADYVDALGHSYEGGVCTECGEADPDYVPEEEHCDCICHGNSIFAKIVRLLYTILSIIRFGRVSCCPDMEYLLDIGDIT